MDLSLVNLLSS